MQTAHARPSATIRSIEERMRENRENKQRRLHRVAREEREIARADEEYELLARALRDVRAHMTGALLPGSGSVNLKNADVMRVWLAIQGAFAAPFAHEGLVRHQLYSAMRVAMPGIPDSTMRSHLHRLKKKKALTQIGSHWFLEQKENQSRQDHHVGGVAGHAVGDQ